MVVAVVLQVFSVRLVVVVVVVLSLRRCVFVPFGSFVVAAALVVAVVFVAALVVAGLVG